MRLRIWLLVFFIFESAGAEIHVGLADSQENLKVQNSRLFYNFGRVPINSFNTIYYTVTNRGSEDLQFTNSNFWGVYFYAFHTCAMGLAPQEQCEFEIRYWPSSVGFHSGRFDLRFHAETSGADTISVDLRGEAIR